MAIKIVVESAHIKRFLAKLDGYPRVRERHLKTAMVRATRELQRAVKAATPVRTGRLRSGWKIRMNRARLGRLVNRVPYGVFIIKGTKAHHIYPRNKKVLKFKIGGKDVFAAHVFHPGTKANDFVSRASRKAEGKIQRIFKQEMEEALKELKVN